MKKNLLKVLMVVALLFASFLLYSCSSSEPSYSGDTGGSYEPENEDNNVVVDTNRKVYYVVDYYIYSNKHKEIKTDINKKVDEFGGYISQSSEGKNYSKYIYRVPTDRLEEFLDYVDQNGDAVDSKNIQSYDITSQYNEVDAQIEVLEASRAAYVKMLEADGITLDNVITIQNKIDDIDTKLKGLYYSKGEYDNKIEYSTIKINYSKTYQAKPFISEYGEYLGNFFKYLGVAILYLLPVMLVGGVVFACVFVPIKLRRRKG